MNLDIIIIAMLVGYLSGSVSYAVLVTRFVAPGGQLSQIRISVPDSDLEIESDSISATTVRMQLGARYGCLVSILDMAKAAVPALLFRFLYPDGSYYLFAAGMATVGHNWPIFHRFHGGRGLSTILGGLLVVDWLGLLITNLIAAPFGIWRKNMLVTTGGFIFLMIPWLWLRSQDVPALLYTAVVGTIYWVSMLPEIKEFIRIRNSSDRDKFVDATELRVIGADGKERVDTITVPAMRRRIAGWLEKRGIKRKRRQKRDGQ